MYASPPPPLAVLSSSAALLPRRLRRSGDTSSTAVPAPAGRPRPIFFNLGLDLDWRTAPQRCPSRLRRDGASMFRFLSSLHQNKGYGQSFLKAMSQNSNGRVIDCQIGDGVVLPASEFNVGKGIHAIRSGKVIAIPTDTLYGFACDACSAEAIKRIYEIKGRQERKPLVICVADVSDISRFAIVDRLTAGLLDNLLPGPVTVVLRRGDSSNLAKSLNPGLDSIGIRVPDCKFVRMLARGSESALALTSANRSGQPSSVRIKDFENLWQHCAFVFDGGLLASGCAGSTVVDLTVPGKYMIVRAGSCALTRNSTSRVVVLICCARKETTEILKRFTLEGEASSDVM